MENFQKKIISLIIRSGRPFVPTDRPIHVARSTRPRRSRSCPHGFTSAVARPAHRGRLIGPPPLRQFTAWPTHVAQKSIYVKCFKCSRVCYGCCKSRSGCCIYCNDYIRMLRVSIQNVSSTLDVCYKYFIWMLHMLQ
jgi:hypothetical protein